MNIFQQIRADHDALRGILRAISSTKGDSQDRRRLFARLLEAMKTHTIAEEQSLYTALMGWPELMEQCRHYVIAHAEVDELLQDLEYEDMSHPCWKIKFYRLRYALESHMEDEEQNMLCRAEQLVTARQIEYLGTIYRAQKQRFHKVA